MQDIDGLESVAKRLSDVSEETRFKAVNELYNLESVGTIPVLMKAVGDSSYRVREKAIEKICSYPGDKVFPRLEAYLRDGDNANNRTAAMEAFPRYGRDAIPYLLKLLKDYDEEIRAFCAVMMGILKDPSAVDGLIETLKDEDENVKHAAAESLGKIGDARAVRALIKCLDDDFWVKYPAIIALGEIGDPSATEHLVPLIEDDMLKQAVVEALGRIGDVSAVSVLADTLSHSDNSIRNDTIAALVGIQSKVDEQIITSGKILPSIKKTLDDEDLIEHILKSLKSTEREVKKNAVIAVGWLKEKRAVKELIESLSDYELEEYVVGSLVSIGKDALPELVDCLSNSEPKVRVSIIRCIGWMDNMDGIKACIPCLSDDNIEVRLQAIMAMTNALHLKEVEGALFAMLSDPDPDVGGPLIEALGNSSSPSLVSKLHNELSCDDLTRKLAVIQILGRIKNKETFGPLRGLLKDDSDEVRAEAYRALSSIRANEMTTTILLEGLSDKSPTVRKASAGSLGDSAAKDAEASLISLLKDPDPGVQLVAVETLGKTGMVSAVDSLIEAFGEGDKHLKLCILNAMSNIRHKSCTSFLCDTLKISDTGLKRAATESLAAIGDTRSVPDLIVALDDSDWSVRCAAVTALGKLGDSRSVSHLLNKLDDSEDIIKRSAITALAEIGARDAVSSILPLIHDESLQLEVLEAVKKLGIPELDDFFAFFGRCNTRLKGLLVDTMGRLKDPGVMDCLIKVLEDEFFTVRCRAARALAELGDVKAIPALHKSQKDDPSEEVRREAALALKRLNRNK